MRYDVLALISGLAACGGSQQHVQQVGTSEPRSWAEHMESSQQHEQNAAEAQTLAHEYRHMYRSESMSLWGQYERGFDDPEVWNCGDTVIQDQVTTGGHILTHAHPCYNLYVEPWFRNHFLAKRERAQARDQREAAASLVHEVNTECEGLPDSAISSSAFAQRDQIAEVIPDRAGGELRGVTIVFQRNAMSADQVRRGVACRRAIWSMHGQRPGDAGNDPTLVPDAQVDVREVGGRVVVEVVARDVQAAAVAIARAEGTPPPAGSQPSHPEEPEQTARR